MGPEKIRFKREVNGRGVCKELMNHEDVLLKLETKIINNGKGHARASAHGLRAIMETMLHGSQF